MFRPPPLFMSGYSGRQCWVKDDSFIFYVEIEGFHSISNSVFVVSLILQYNLL